jgi:hypothetical protein
LFYSPVHKMKKKKRIGRSTFLLCYMLSETAIDMIYYIYSENYGDVNPLC